MLRPLPSYSQQTKNHRMTDLWPWLEPVSALISIPSSIGQAFRWVVDHWLPDGQEAAGGAVEAFPNKLLMTPHSLVDPAKGLIPGVASHLQVNAQSMQDGLWLTPPTLVTNSFRHQDKNLSRQICWPPLFHNQHSLGNCKFSITCMIRGSPLKHEQLGENQTNVKELQQVVYFSTSGQ